MNHHPDQDNDDAEASLSARLQESPWVRAWLTASLGGEAGVTISAHDFPDYALQGVLSLSGSAGGPVRDFRWRRHDGIEGPQEMAVIPFRDIRELGGGPLRADVVDSDGVQARFYLDFTVRPVRWFPWPIFPTSSLAVSVVQGKGPVSPGLPYCETLLVLVAGTHLPSPTGTLLFYNSQWQQIWDWNYTWDPNGPATQLVAELAGNVLQSAAGGEPGLGVMLDGDPSVVATFTLLCDPGE